MEKAPKKNTITDQKKFTEDENLWYFRPWIITGAIFTFGPLALPLIWFRPRTKQAVKIGVSTVVIIMTISMYIQTAKYYEYIKTYYNNSMATLERLKSTGVE